MVRYWLLPFLTGLCMAQTPRLTGYPASKQGGQYMHNFYLPPSPSTTRTKGAPA